MSVLVAVSQPRISEYLANDAERPFIHRALDGKLGDADRLAYAQLLEPLDPERAEWLRLEVALHSRAADDPAQIARFVELARKIGLDYANLLLRETILNCGSEAVRAEPRPVRFAFNCTKRWQTLAPTEDTAARFCQQCQERVYYCDTVADAERRAFAGQCIAIPKRLSNGGLESEMLGRPDPVREWADVLFTAGPGAGDSDTLAVIYTREEGLLGRAFGLGTSGPTTIGRGVDNTIVLAGDGISRRHARFERRADAWWVVDEGSTCGTYVNGGQVQERALQIGDRIGVGTTIVKLVAGRRRSR